MYLQFEVQRFTSNFILKLIWKSNCFDFYFVVVDTISTVVFTKFGPQIKKDSLKFVSSNEDLLKMIIFLNQHFIYFIKLNMLNQQIFNKNTYFSK